jgi:hypothetical protein
MTDCVDLGAERYFFLGRSLGAGASRHSHVVFGRYHTGDPLLAEPPQIRLSPKAPIKDQLVQAGILRHVHPGLANARVQRASCSWIFTTMAREIFVVASINVISFHP